jgi:hypothetical protein
MKSHAARARKGYHRKQFDHGWEFVHIAIDDCTRLAYVEVLADEKPATAIAFLRRAVAFYRRHGITVERLMTDNASPIARPCTPSPVAHWAFVICAPGPTAPRATHLPSASWAPCGASALTGS